MKAGISTILGPANSRGVSAVVLCVFVACIALPITALTLGSGQVMVARAETQNAVDAAALGGANTIYPDELQPSTMDPDTALAVANHLITANGVEPSSCTVELGHFTLGGAGTFSQGVNGSVPDWAEVTTEQLNTDTLYTNAVRVVCGYSGLTYFLGWAFGGDMEAIALKRIKEAEAPATGVQLAKGSALCK